MAELSLLAIAIGGGLGSVARFVISREMGLKKLTIKTSSF